MRSLQTIPSSILVLLLATAWACAQNLPPRLEVFLEGGSSFSNSGTLSETLISPDLPCPSSGCAPLPVAMTGSFPETIRPTAGARYRFTRRNALEASYSYSLYHFVVHPAIEMGTTPLAFAGYNRDDLVSFNYVRYLSVAARVQPFLTFGLGTNRFSGPSNAPAVVTGYVRADNGWQFAWNYGAGADVVFQRHFALRLELRDYITGQPPSAPTGPNHIMSGPGSSHNVVPSLGVVFRFK